MHIALVIDYSLDYLGGAQNAFLDQAKILSNAGHSVTIIAPEMPSSAWQKSWNGEIVTVKPRFTLPGFELPVIRSSAQLQARITKLIRQKNIDIVHLHSEFGLTAAAADAARRAGVPVVHTVHTFFWQARLPCLFDALAAPLVRFFAGYLTGRKYTREHALAPAKTDSALRSITLTQMRAADLVVSPSAHQEFRIKRAGVPHTTVLPNPLPPDALAASDSAAYTAVTQPLRLVWVGRIVAEKRILEFIKGFKIACQMFGSGELQLTVIGAGPLSKNARRLAKSLPVIFTGRLDRKSVLDAIKQAGAVVLSSYGFDNQPVVIAEAVTAGRPVLLCDPLIVEGLSAGSGIYAAGHEPYDFARLLGELLADKHRLVRAAQATKKDAETFAPATYLTKITSHYRKLTEGENPPC